MEMELKTKEFEEFRALIYQESGIKLESGKEHLIQFRLGHRLEQLGMKQFRTYLDWVKRPEGMSEVVHMLDAISTNVTSFYREPAHFEFAKEMVLDWTKKGRKHFRIWSAACSSGEEPFSLAMALAECKLSADCDLRIIASDISTKILGTAQEGIYSQEKLEHLPKGFQSQYFDSVKGTLFRVKPELKEAVSFQRQNLSLPPYDIHGPLDMIFLRNVLIYFDAPVRTGIINECFRLLKPGGFLLIGHSETLNALDTRFKCVRPSYYKKPTE
jgi:chemotaxis protein methyltransferase CheR